MDIINKNGAYLNKTALYRSEQNLHNQQTNIIHQYGVLFYLNLEKEFNFLKSRFKENKFYITSKSLQTLVLKPARKRIRENLVASTRYL